jgi:co-chaperonin GroES (HSP10)
MISNEAWATEENVPTPENVPQPVGYRILIRPRASIEKTKGGIILTDTNRDSQSYLNSVGQVIAMGNECYSNRENLGAKSAIGLFLVDMLEQEYLYKKLKWCY